MLLLDLSGHLLVEVGQVVLLLQTGVILVPVVGGVIAENEEEVGGVEFALVGQMELSQDLLDGSLHGLHDGLVHGDEVGMHDFIGLDLVDEVHVDLVVQQDRVAELVLQELVHGFLIVDVSVQLAQGAVTHSGSSVGLLEEVGPLLQHALQLFVVFHRNTLSVLGEVHCLGAERCELDAVWVSGSFLPLLIT